MLLLGDVLVFGVFFATFLVGRSPKGCSTSTVLMRYIVRAFSLIGQAVRGEHGIVNKSDPRTLKDRVVVVTGTSRGIGRAIAVRPTADGASVALFANTETPEPQDPRGHRPGEHITNHRFGDDQAREVPIGVDPADGTCQPIRKF
jgi:hypothetical protein